MTRPTKTRKNEGVGEAKDFGRVDLNVVHPTDVSTYRPNIDGILGAMGQFREQVRTERDEKTKELFALSEEQGQLDQALNKVNEERMAGDRAYSEGVMRGKVKAKGVDWLAESGARLKKAFDADPNMDIDQFMRDEVQDTFGDATQDSKLAIRDKVAIINSANQNLRTQYGAMVAKKREEEALLTYGQLGLSLARAPTSDDGMLKQLRVSAAEMGMGDDEARDANRRMFMALLESDNLRGYALAEKAELLDTPQAVAEFEAAKQNAEKRIETAKYQAQNADTAERMEVEDNYTNRIRTGARVTNAELMADTRLMPEERERFNRMQNAEDDRRRDEAISSSNKALADQLKQRQLTDAWEKGPAAVQQLIAFGGAKKTEVQNFVDRQWAVFGGAVFAEDPQLRAQGVEGMKQLIRQTAGYGYTPAGFKHLFNASTSSTPAQLQKSAELYRELKAAGLRDSLSDMMDAGALARMEAIQAAVDLGGETMEEAVRVQAERVVSLEEAVRLSSGYASANAREAQLAKLSKEMGVDARKGQLAADFLKAQQYHITTGVDAALAAEKAAETIKAKHVVVDGVIVPAGWFSASSREAFEEALPTYRKEVLLPALKERYGDHIEDVQLRPAPNTPGVFYLQDPASGNPVTSKDGKVMTVTVGDMRTPDGKVVEGIVAKATRLQQVRRKAQEEAGAKAREAELQDILRTRDDRLRELQEPLQEYGD